MKPPKKGSSHSPARSGDRPSTSCRYCVMKRNAPKVTKVPSAYVASAALNAGTWKSRGSISGSASLRCLRTNAVPMMRPVRMATTVPPEMPRSAVCLRP